MIERFQIGRIDEIIHGRARLGVMAYLMVENPAEFTTLRSRLDLNEGTLSVHLRKLHDAGYVDIEKTYKGRRPLTRVHLLPKGRRAFRDYLDTMELLLNLGE